MTYNTIIVINCGSSSIKFALIYPHNNKTILTGLAEKLGKQDAKITIDYKNKKFVQEHDNASYGIALAYVKDFLEKHSLLKDILAIGHRVVHGGDYFKNPVIIDNHVIERIKKLIPLAPLHNPAHIAGIKFCQKILPKLPQVAVFDTSFHQTLAKQVYSYALPQEYSNKYHIRKYGFHGISHEYVSKKASNILNIKDGNFISTHLGNGCSITAIKNGKSINTTMGFTPLDGLVMGTRSGSIDPGIFIYLNTVLKLNVKQITDILYKKSGLLGICGNSDMREIEILLQQEDHKAKLALDMFCNKIAHYIASYLVYFDSFDGLIFTGGIGENSKIVRKTTINKLCNVGFALSNHKKEINPNCFMISSKDSKPIMIIPTNEEMMIAQFTNILIKST